MGLRTKACALLCARRFRDARLLSRGKLQKDASFRGEEKGIARELALRTRTIWRRWVQLECCKKYKKEM
jgi:hypothetical protein